MSKLKQILSVSFLFLWVALPLAAQDLENPDYLKQGAWGLAKQNKPQSLYLFLEGQFPTFTATAQKAGLVDLLDGTRNWSSFEADWKTELKSYTPQKGQPSEAALSKLFESFKSVMTVNPTKAATPGESVAEFLKNRPPPDTRARSLLERFWDVANHPLKNWEKFKTVSIKEAPSKLVWFNPDLAIPELEIRPGKLLTKAQQVALETLFSVKVTHDATDIKIGEAFFPSEVGRAINPADGVLNVIEGNEGRLLPDLTLKGTGPNAGGYRDGLLSISEAIFDAEISLSLERSGVRMYTPVAVLQDPVNPKNAIYVRASTSLLRMSHLKSTSWNQLDPAELKLLLENIHRNAQLGEGRDFKLYDWVARELPKMAGQNAGRMAQLGVQHGSATDSNIGLGEQVDFGEPSLKNKPSEAQKDWHLRSLKTIAESANQILPPTEQIDMAELESRFNEAYEIGRKTVRTRGYRVAVDAVFIEMMGDHLPRLYKSAGWSSNGGYFKALDSMTEMELRQELVRLKIESKGDAAAMTAEEAKTRIKEAFNNAQGQEMTDLLERLGTVEDRADLSEWMKESHSIEDLRDMARKQGAIEVESLNRSQLARLLHAAKNGWVGFEIKVGEVKGELVVLEMNGKKAKISGATNIDKATVLRMKPGHAAVLGKALPCEHVAFVGEFKNGTWTSRPAFAGQLVPGRAPKPTVAQPRPRRPGRLPKPMVHALGQTGLFAGGYLLKETFYGIKDRDPARIKQGFKTVSSPMFAGSLGVFMGLQFATDKAMTSLRGSTRMAKFGKAFTRFALPLYAGTAILAVASGHSSVHDVMVDATAFGLSMLAFAPLDIAMAPLLAMGPPGWVAYGAVKVVQIALMLDLAERLRPVLDPLVRSAEKKVGKGWKWAKKKAKSGASWTKKKAKGGASWTKKKAKGGASWTKKKAKGGASWTKKKAKGGASWTKKKASSALSTGKSGGKSFWKDIKKRTGAVKKGTKSASKKGWKKLKKSGSKVKKGLKKLKFW